MIRNKIEKAPVDAKETPENDNMPTGVNQTQ